MIKFLYQNGWSQIIFYFCHFLAFAGVFTINILFGKKYKVAPKDSIVTTLIVWPLAYLWMLILAWAATGFQFFGGQNIVRIFIWIPVISLLAVKLLKIEWKTMCDFLAPCVCLNHAFGHLGCIFEGCCKGYPAKFGFYNPGTGETLFPIQLLESLVAFAIVAILLVVAKKKNYKADGKLYSLMLILFGTTRFLLEFGRDNEKVFMGCSSLAFHALLMAVVGTVAMLVIQYREKKKAALVSEN